VATLEDGLYVVQKSLQDPKMVDRLARFLKASIKGWEYAKDHPDEGARIVLDNDTTGAQTEAHQQRMMSEVDKLLDDDPAKVGYLDPADYDRTIKVLLYGGSDPVVSKPPQGAWTHQVWDAMQKLKM
jgi:NitT/TauT family transport system substrate-binding protein